MGHFILGALLAYTAGVFTPGVARKLKALLVKEANSVKADIHAEAAKVEKDVKSKL